MMAGIRPLAEHLCQQCVYRESGLKNKPMTSVGTPGVSIIRLIFRNHSSFCTFFAMSIFWTLQGTPSSSSVQLILCPLGVPAVYLLSVSFLPNGKTICSILTDRWYLVPPWR